MSIRGRWQVVEIPGYDMALASAYILFNEAGGEFAFDCLTGSIHGACHCDAVSLMRLKPIWLNRKRGTDESPAPCIIISLVGCLSQ
jgi:hypothetical protein